MPGDIPWEEEMFLKILEYLYLHQMGSKVILRVSQTLAYVPNVKYRI
jgi:hypothetical protein